MRFPYSSVKLMLKLIGRTFGSAFGLARTGQRTRYQKPSEPGLDLILDDYAPVENRRFA
jgi:hypothetical protein